MSFRRKSAIDPAIDEEEKKSSLSRNPFRAALRIDPLDADEDQTDASAVSVTDPVTGVSEGEDQASKSFEKLDPLWEGSGEEPEERGGDDRGEGREAARQGHTATAPNGLKGPETEDENPDNPAPPDGQDQPRQNQTPAQPGRSKQEKVLDDLVRVVGEKSLQGALTFPQTQPEPERAEAEQARDDLLDRIDDGDTQGATGPLRFLVGRRERALPDAKAERQPARGPGSEDLPYLDKQDQAEDFAQAMKSGPDAATRRAAAEQRSSLSTTFVTTPPVVLAKHQDDPAPSAAALPSHSQADDALHGVQFAQADGLVTTDAPVQGDGFASQEISAAGPNPGVVGKLRDS
ncbi:MAG: hypothetical protein AAF909_07775, partial [Pseudomonadota bacterium]